MTKDLDVLDRIIDAEHPTPDSVTLKTKDEDEVKFSVELITDRGDRWDYMSEMPDGLFDKDGDGGQKIPDGGGAEAMEDVFIHSLSHPDYPEEEMEFFLDQIQDEILFEISITILDKSMRIGEVTGFRFNQ